jgi:uncharacterized protein
MNASTFAELRDSAISCFRCGRDSIHGVGHWRNVEDTAMLIAPETGADVVVCRLFAIFHDCCRIDDGSDLDHGRRAAALIRSLGSKLSLDFRRAELLLEAVERHTDGETTGDPTIGTCWDADRLDLGRVGIIPGAKWMSTTAGRQIAELGTKALYIEKRGTAGRL